MNDDINDWVDDATPAILAVCPECNRGMLNIKACDPPALEVFGRWKHLCIANKVFRWCGTFGSLHLDVYKILG